MKKLLLLGGSRYLLPVIETAHKLNIYTITCDYLPDNIAHKYSDEYCNVSIVDKKAVLDAAKKLKIDGVMSFACDPGVVTAAYIAEKMGLPFQGSYESTAILQDKGLFREFLTNNNFNVPHARSYQDKKEPFNDLDFFTWPVIVKPVDSAGSKGINRVDSPDFLEEAIKKAVDESRSGRFLIEDFLTFDGYHSSTDFFTVNGRLEFASYSDQLFDDEADNPYTPAKIIWPSSMKGRHQQTLTDEIQRLMTLLHMKTGIYNIETCVGSDGRPYIMEVSPRGGGCKIAELQKLAFGVDLIEEDIRKAVGFPVHEINQNSCDGHWCELVVHARPGQSGILKEVVIDKSIKNKYVKVIDMTAKPGDIVKPFTGANMSLGDIFLKFENREELDNIMDRVNEWLRIEVEEENVSL